LVNQVDDLRPLMERLILARHGESAYNPLRRVNGDPSRRVPLTERGREEARALGQSVADEPIDLCVVTEFPRTQQTADIALDGRHVPRLVVPELNEPRFGDFEGESIDRVRAWIREHGTQATPSGGGESRVGVIRRYCRGYRLLAPRPEPIVLVVAHGLPVEALVLAARGAGIPLTLESFPAAHARPRRLTREELEAGIRRMARWVREQEAAA
jgi:2,3-bisphosphoglycerate-dependent phosphoglycerate mutase